jgi:hypothetical protein
MAPNMDNGHFDSSCQASNKLVLKITLGHSYSGNPLHIPTQDDIRQISRSKVGARGSTMLRSLLIQNALTCLDETNKLGIEDEYVWKYATAQTCESLGYSIDEQLVVDTSSSEDAFSSAYDEAVNITSLDCEESQIGDSPLENDDSMEVSHVSEDAQWYEPSDKQERNATACLLKRKELEEEDFKDDDAGSLKCLKPSRVSSPCGLSRQSGSRKILSSVDNLFQPIYCM